jgi:hypothetical protein
VSAGIQSSSLKTSSTFLRPAFVQFGHANGLALSAIAL